MTAPPGDRGGRPHLLAAALAHAQEAAERHRCAYLVWVREQHCPPLKSLDRRGQESGLHQTNLTVFVRPAPGKPGKTPARANPKDAYVYARVTPGQAWEVLPDDAPTDL
jgi:hypothetical protein